MSNTLTKSLIAVTSGVLGYAVYKAKFDPPHIVWDLDETLLYSVCPLPNGKAADNLDDDDDDNKYPKDPSRSFDHIDDDFPFEPGVPNTRTFWRPGAKLALRICRLFCHQSVFTAAQSSYTTNIMAQLGNQASSALFDNIIHRDMVSVRDGKDLSHISKDRMDRLLLFDDRVKNFAPQNGSNGIHVLAYNDRRLKDENIVEEFQEIFRWIGIALLALLVPDVRQIVPYFLSSDHKERYSMNRKESRQ